MIGLFDISGSKLLYDLFALLLRSRDGVVNSENVFRVDCILNLLLPVDCHLWDCALNKSFSYFTNTVMVTY
jgi:hypothetical protein